MTLFCQIGIYRAVYPSDVILSDRRESKDLRTDLTANVIKMRRFFDFALRAPLRMTYLVVRCE